MPGVVVAMGGGGFSTEPENGPLDEYVLSRARVSNPRVCFVPTASGDNLGYVTEFYRAYSRFPCRPTDLALFERKIADLRSFVLEQDVIYVGGGSTANLLAVWRTHGLDAILRDAWEAGAVLCGVSAGMNCWFEASVTDSFDLAALAPLNDGVGLLPGSACPHYDGEEQRRPTYLRLVADGTLPDGYAADDGAAVVFDGTAFREAVSSRPRARVVRVTRDREAATEGPVEMRYLGT